MNYLKVNIIVLFNFKISWVAPIEEMRQISFKVQLDSPFSRFWSYKYRSTNSKVEKIAGTDEENQWTLAVDFIL